jgi:hypothetical protein
VLVRRQECWQRCEKYTERALKRFEESDPLWPCALELTKGTNHFLLQQMKIEQMSVKVRKFLSSWLATAKLTVQSHRCRIDRTPSMLQL